MLTDKLLKPEEILDKIDAKQAVEDLREPLTRTIDTMARDLAEQLRPGLWDSLPAAGRNAVLSRVHAAAPGVVDNILVAMKEDLPRFVDLQYLAVTTLVRNKVQLNELMKGMGGAAMKFIRRSGIYFGLRDRPGADGRVGLVSQPVDHADVRLLHRVRQRLAGPQPDLHPSRAEEAAGLHPRARRASCTTRKRHARLRAHLANDLFSADVLLEAILNGPTSERLFAAVEKEISAAIDAQAGVARPVITLAIGTKRYREAKDSVVRMVLERLPDTMQEAKDYTAKTLDIENLIVDKDERADPRPVRSHPATRLQGRRDADGHCRRDPRLPGR